MQTKNPTAADFFRVGNELIGAKREHRTAVAVERFKAFFKVHPRRCAEIFALIRNKMPQSRRNMHPKHLLWTLHFMLTYDIERRIAPKLGTNRNTLREWIWPIMIAIASLKDEVVSAKRLQHQLLLQSF